ncbi:hypothetical protein B0H14DRAFT_2746157, partial [Mycena olivaceomarginata]
MKERMLRTRDATMPYAYSDCDMKGVLYRPDAPLLAPPRFLPAPPSLRIELKLRVLVWNASNSPKTTSVQSAVTRRTVQTSAWRPKSGSSVEVKRKAAVPQKRSSRRMWAVRSRGGNGGGAARLGEGMDVRAEVMKRAERRRRFVASHVLLGLAAWRCQEIG